MKVAVYDTKSYDREYLVQAARGKLSFQFHEFRLGVDTAPSAAGCDAVCVFVNDTVDRACIEALLEQNVRLVALRCAGFNNVDLEAIRDSGLRLVRVPAYSPNAVAEHTVALLLSLNRKIHRAYNRVRDLNFSLKGLVGFDIHVKTIGIVGTGKIGRITAEIFRGFGAAVVASDPFPQIDWAGRHDIRYVDLDELLAISDVISLHAPLTPQTLHLLDKQTLAQTKQGVHIINTSRGKLIDTTALIDGLKSGQIGGVALDVYEEEAGVFFEDLSGEVLADDELARLLTFPNVLITAHQAFLTTEALREISRVTVENILCLGAGKAFLEGTEVCVPG